MNILRKSRKSKTKLKLNKFLLIIFTLVMTTFAWFTYTKVLSPTFNIHVASWDIEYYIGTEKKENPISVDIDTLYPAMPEQTVTIDIVNNGETLVDIAYEVKAITIAGITFELINEGQTNTTENYIILKQPELSTNEETGEEIYTNTIINDTTQVPFTISIEHSSQVAAISQNETGDNVPGTGYLTITVNWVGDNDELDSEWGYKVGEYLINNPTATSAMTIELSINSYQAI